MVVHNHPSGNPEPSRADKEVTTELLQAGNICDVDAVSAAFPKEKNICTSKVYSLFFRYLWQLLGTFLKNTEGSKMGNIEKLAKFWYVVKRI